MAMLISSCELANDGDQLCEDDDVAILQRNYKNKWQGRGNH